MDRGTPTTPQKSTGEQTRGIVVSPDISTEGSEIARPTTEVHTETIPEESFEGYGVPELNVDNRVARRILEAEDVTPTTGAITNYMMYSMQQGNGGVELPTLKTGPWKYKPGDVPNPLSIARARRLLALGYAKIPCEIPGTGIHGYAWMIEKPGTWEKRNGVGAHQAVIDAKPMKSELTAQEANDITKVIMHNMKMRPFALYNHLKEAGKDKISEWFGDDMFVDMYQDGILPPQTTPNAMLEHLEGTYAQPNHFRRLMGQVEKVHNSQYDAKVAVEKYFMTLQEAREDATLLEQPFTDKQTMNKATTQFISAHGRVAEKAERTWNKKTEKERTWGEFKAYWKEEIHMWSLSEPRDRQNNNVSTLETELQSIRGDVTALQVENRGYQQENHNLRTQQWEIQQALQAEQSRCYVRDNERDDRSRSSRTSSDDISALTEAISSLSKDVRDLQNQSRGTGSNDTRAGRSKKYLYCWKCGCQTSHWTRQCRLLTKEEKQKYRSATGVNTMGGNQRLCERYGKYEADFNE